MSNDDTPEMKLVFAPGCFDNFEGTQEELEELVAHIKKSFESGELLEMSEEIDMIELSEEDPEFFEQIQNALASDIPPRNLH